MVVEYDERRRFEERIDEVSHLVALVLVFSVLLTAVRRLHPEGHVVHRPDTRHASR